MGLEPPVSLISLSKRVKVISLRLLPEHNFYLKISEMLLALALRRQCR